MKENRRDFIRKAAMGGASLAFLPGLLHASRERKKEYWSLPLGVCTGIQNASLLKDLGYHFIEEGVGGFLKPAEGDDVFAEKYQAFLDGNMPVRSCNGFIPGHLKSTGPETHHEEILVYANTAFERAAKTNIKYIVFGSGGSRRLPDGWSREQGETQFADLLSRMGPLAASHGITVVIEPLNSAEVNFINSLADGARIVKRVNHPNIQLLADIYHMMRDNEPASEIIKYGKYIQHVHIAEKEERTPPGVKGDDFVPYLRALKKIRYKGGLSLECRWKNFNDEVGVAIKYLESQFKLV
jgi:sugar phosphate isomerase/epimerase